MEYEVIHDFKGSPDGYTIIDYKKGEIVSLVDTLSKVALAEKWVKPSKTAEKEAKAKAKAEAEKEAEEKRSEAIEGEIADLEGRLADAADADKPAIQSALEAKQGEFAAL